jgi:hypothetical protein
MTKNLAGTSTLKTHINYHPQNTHVAQTIESNNWYKNKRNNCAPTIDSNNWYKNKRKQLCSRGCTTKHIHPTCSRHGCIIWSWHLSEFDQCHLASLYLTLSECDLSPQVVVTLPQPTFHLVHHPPPYQPSQHKPALSRGRRKKSVLCCCNKQEKS